MIPSQQHHRYTDPDIRLLSNLPMQFLIGALLFTIGLGTELPWMHELSAPILVIRISLIIGMLACALISARYPSRLVAEILIFGGMLMHVFGMAILGNMKNTYLETSTPAVYQSLAFVAIFMAIRLPVFAVLVTSVGALWFWLVPLFLHPRMDEKLLISHFVGFITYAIMVLVGKHLLQRLLRAELEGRKHQAERTEALQELANRDALTGVYNRHHFERLLPEFLAQARVNATSLCLGFIELSDAMPARMHNHASQKAHALQQLAHALLAVMRRDDAVFRVGEDRLAVILPGANAAEATGIAERLYGQLAHGNLVTPSTPRMAGDATRCVIGVAEIHAGTPVSQSALVMAAEAALREAVAQGAGAVVVHRTAGSEISK